AMVASTQRPERSRQNFSCAPPLFCLAAFLAGTAALIYEILWIRRLGTLLGTTIYSVNVVLAVFFLGLGLGALFFGRMSDKTGKALWIFCTLEVVIGAAGLLFWPASHALDQVYLSLAPSEWSVATALVAKASLAALLLLVPTFCMGGTVPALAKLITHRPNQFTSRFGLVYGFNTIGAAFGALATTFILLPSVGLRATAWLAALINGSAVVIALLANRWDREPRPRASFRDIPSLTGVRFDHVVVLGTAAWAGLAAVSLEVLWTRALATRFTSTVYSFTTILVVFLLCLGVGSLLVTWLDLRKLVTRTTIAVIMVGAGLSGLLSVFFLTRLPAVPLSEPNDSNSLGLVQTQEFLQALVVVSLPTLFFGLSFPVLCCLRHRTYSAIGGSIGSVYLANTAGSVVAPILTGFFLIPAWGLRRTFLVTSWGTVLFGLVVLFTWAGRAQRGLRPGS
ncbi:MAG: fused MFS/spermidine synthase, partial [Chloroflexi bacterium]|nr:fused MFS/spermidine synthase [Chloroflexota bacterium]